jgi:hypothetical protein
VYRRDEESEFAHQLMPFDYSRRQLANRDSEIRNITHRKSSIRTSCHSVFFGFSPSGAHIFIFSKDKQNKSNGTESYDVTKNGAID